MVLLLTLTCCTTVDAVAGVDICVGGAGAVIVTFEAQVELGITLACEKIKQRLLFAMGRRSFSLCCFTSYNASIG